MGSQYTQRTRELQEFNTALHMLETEIDVLTILPQAIEHLAMISPSPHKEFFESFIQQLQFSEGLTTQQAWEATIEEMKDSFCLKEEDWGVLKQFGRALGGSGDKDQIRHLQVAQQRLERLELEAKEEGEKMSRLWNYVGILTGIALVILLY